MPYIKIEITREGVTLAQKKQLIHEANDMMVRILNKAPDSTFVVIDEVDTDNWGVAGENVTTVRTREAAKKAGTANQK